MQRWFEFAGKVRFGTPPVGGVIYAVRYRKECVAIRTEHTLTLLRTSGAPLMTTTIKNATQLILLAAIGVIGAIAFAAPAQAGAVLLSKPSISGASAYEAPSVLQTSSWINRSINKAAERAAKRAKSAAEKRAYEKKRREPETGQIKGKIVLDKPKKQTP